MKCKDCKFKLDSEVTMFDRCYEKMIYSCCDISNRVITQKSECIVSNFDHDNVENMTICYNCKHWIGGGDWGLSCRKDYYVASSNGFDEICDQFERKE